jgi:hypothetical protein
MFCKGYNVWKYACILSGNQSINQCLLQKFIIKNGSKMA